MNEKLEYASMLEIPLSQSTVTQAPAKKKRVKKKKQVNPDLVKEQLLEKINAEQTDHEMQDAQLLDQQTQLENCDFDSNYEISSSSVCDQPKAKRTKHRISIIGVQFAVIGILALTILLTSALLPNSGINVFFSNVFKAEQVELIDERVYSDFTPVISMGDNRGIAISEGVISFGGKGSIYAPCDGVVSAIGKDENGKFSIEITHSQNFKSYLTGVEHAYVGLNDVVYSNIPVGYLLDDGASMCFYNGEGSVISDYTLVDGSVVWEI